MFVISLAHLYSWSGATRTIERHWDVARRILDWARTDGDKDQDGYLEYQTRSSKGTKNQGWKDSGDAVVYDDGRPVPPPLGTCELQGYWFAAQQLMAFMSGAMGDTRTRRRSGEAPPISRHVSIATGGMRNRAQSCWRSIQTNGRFAR